MQVGVDQALEERQGLQKRKRAPAQLRGVGGGCKPGFAAKVGGKLGDQRNAEHTQDTAGALPACIPGKRFDQIENRLHLLCHQRQHRTRAAGRDEEGKGGLVFFQCQHQQPGHQRQRCDL